MDVAVKPNILETLAFSTLPEKALVSKLAHMFLNIEEGLRDDRARPNQFRANDHTVGSWLRTVYKPQRGSTKSLIDSVVVEVARQKIVRQRRYADLTWTRAPKPDTRERYNKIAATLYDLGSYKTYDGVKRNQYNCVILGYLEHYLIALEWGAYGRDVLLFVRDTQTGVSSLHHIKNPNENRHSTVKQPASLGELLMLLAPEKVRRSMFFGTKVRINFDDRTFVVNDSEVVSWCNVVGEPRITKRCKIIKTKDFEVEG